MAATKSLRITLKAPHVTKPGDTVVKEAQAAAQAVIDGYDDLYEAVTALNARGISVTVEDLLSRRGQAPKPARKKARRKKVTRKRVTRKPRAVRKKKTGKSRRTVLSPEQRKAVTDRLQAGATAAKIAAEFGVSTATVSNIKRAAGLSKPRAKKAKAKKAEN